MLKLTAVEAFAVLVCPTLIIVQLIVETPVLRWEPATQRRRTAATVLAIISLLAAARLLITTGTLDAFGVLLLAGLVIPAILTLVRLGQLPRAEATL